MEYDWNDGINFCTLHIIPFHFFKPKIIDSLSFSSKTNKLQNFGFNFNFSCLSPSHQISFGSEEEFDSFQILSFVTQFYFILPSHSSQSSSSSQKLTNQIMEDENSQTCPMSLLHLGKWWSVYKSDKFVDFIKNGSMIGWYTIEI